MGVRGEKPGARSHHAGIGKRVGIPCGRTYPSPHDRFAHHGARGRVGDVLSLGGYGCHIEFPNP
tara:strand:- start:7956 stop:8147 length:192 start_codon:yes stop_codon:yes gene_type:complete